MLLIFNSLESSLGALEIVYAAAVSRFISDSGKKNIKRLEVGNQFEET